MAVIHFHILYFYKIYHTKIDTQLSQYSIEYSNSQSGIQQKCLTIATPAGRETNPSEEDLYPQFQTIQECPPDTNVK